MKVSVVIPVFNKAPYLKACLDSVFAQSFQDFEVVAVDDASTDDSLAILRSCADPRLRIMRNERNMGPGAAAQRAMDAATGEYIIRVDADDITQQVFVSAWRSRSSIDPSRITFPAWLITITRRRVADELERRSRENRRVAAVAAEATPKHAPPAFQSARGHARLSGASPAASRISRASG